MAQWQPIPLGKESYQPRSGTQSVERLVNLYPEPSQKGSKTAFTLYGTPGLSKWTSVGDGPIRGVRYANGYFWIVSGQELFAVTLAKVAVLVGTIARSGPVRMIHDATHVVICTQQEAYAATPTSIVTLPEINLAGAAYQDGFGIYAQRNTQFVWLSELDDLTDIPALDFTSADAKSDNVVTLVSDQREVWVFKQLSTEIFANTGEASFPFTRTGFMERGCGSPGSVANDGTYVFWLGDDLRVYRAAGYQPEAISTPAIDRMISEASSPETSEAFIYAQAGHTFYVLTCADLTVVYDLVTGKWHERESYGLGRWRAHGYANAGQLHLVGNYNGPEIYEMDLDVYDEDGEPLVWEIRDPPLSADPRPITVHELHFDHEMGVGLTSGQGSDPVMLLSWSDDDGRTWSNDIEIDLGEIGKYRNRATATRLGRSHNRTHRIRSSDPVKRVILGRGARIEVAAA